MANTARKPSASQAALVNMRVPRRQRTLIDRAAAVTGKTRTEFVLEAASRAAEEILLDRRLFVLDEAAFKRFVAVLDAPAKPNPGLQRLLARKAPWER
jgi:uncharacterized protein (DUF1778 family)